MPKVRCKTCKVSVDRNVAVKAGLSHFCCDEHMREYLYARPKAKPAAGPTKATREFVLKRDNHRCSLCASQHSLHIHHIEYRSEGGPHTSDNLITLCLKCHDLIHSNKKVYQALCQEIVASRESKRS